MLQTEISTILDAAFDAVGLATPNPWKWVYANPQLAKWMGKILDELPGQLLEAAFAEDSRIDFAQAAERVWNAATVTCTVWLRLATDDEFQPPVEVRLCRIETEQPLLGVIMHRLPERAISGRVDPARLDPLTNLPDRTFLLTRLGSLMRGERSADRNFAVLFVDLDDFKQVNDCYGHLVGDSVLREAARRLSQSVREGDHVVRFGGDEFVVLVEQVAGWNEIDAIITRIRAALAKPIELSEGEVTLSLSVGVAEASSEHRSPEELLRAADQAMYLAKPARANAPALSSASK